MSNSNNASASASGGIGIFGLLTAILLVFKLAGMAGVSWGLADLSWVWVFAPLAIGFAIYFTIILVVLLIAAIATR